MRKPETIDEAISILMNMIADGEKAEVESVDADHRVLFCQTLGGVKDTPEDELVFLNEILGDLIRDEFGLWEENRTLLAACGSEDMHPSDASLVILKSLWIRLHS